MTSSQMSSRCLPSSFSLQLLPSVFTIESRGSMPAYSGMLALTAAPREVIDHEIEESSNRGVRKQYWCSQNVSIGHISTNLSTLMQRVHAVLRADVRADTYVRIYVGWHVAASFQISYIHITGRAKRRPRRWTHGIQQLRT